ncbi:TonB-dependent receptor [Achromobacter seleniivolatilans]|uniref:TonB-dependent receptor n=1 Tax=Achromobacter seleniivolatilans TaxID=3047478 RepID=A0ABY9LYH7_9BURK|nr:TonB-dependent receptor [Achromobacter sp. R39]WMD19741.1 TonB-dependent receptor [Achromobacter sp. R39]
MHVAPASRRPASPALQRTLYASTLKAALSAAFIVIPVLLAPTAAHAQAQTRGYDIPGGPLGDVLGRYGREAGIVLSFRPELTDGRQSNGLKGSYTASSGLAALLAGTGLQAAQQGSGSYVLSRQPASNDGTATLPAVTVTATSHSELPEAYAGGQVARGGSLGVLGTVDIMDTPFSTTNYTAQMLEDQQARTLADVVVNEASVRVMTSTGSFSEDFQIRGFNVTSGDVGLNGLYGLTSSNRMPAALMERVEVLKGPGTLMYGISPNGAIGGNINIVTKRAGDTPLTRLTTTYESKSVLGAQLDMGRRFGEDNQWGIRFNGVYRNGDTTLDNGKQKFGLGALALDYRSPTLRWSLDTYSQRENVDNFRAQTGFKPGISSIPAAPSGHRAIYDGANLMSRDSAIASRLEYDISDRLMVYAAGGYRYGASEQDFPSARTTDAVDALGNFRVINSWYDAYSRNKTGEIGARANFDTFGIKHRVSLSGSILKTEAGSFYLSAPLSQKIDSNIYDPVPLIPMTGDRQTPTKNSETTLSSISLTDTLSFANDRVLITGGLRKQQVKAENFNAAGAVTTSYNEGAVSPLAGIVVRPWENVSVYGNFTSGLTRGGTAPVGTANVGEVFAPYKSKQYEAGVKVDWGTAITTVSVFQIDRPNAMTNPVTNVYSFDGEQRNRGIELSAVGEVTPGLRLMASATFYDAKLERTAGGVNQGNNANGVPKRTFNLGADWDLPWVRGLSLNARAIHTAATPYDAENTLTLPSWTRYDVGARYRTEIMGKQVTFRANVENVFNKSYWLSSSTLLTVGTVAAPRTVLLSAQVEF